MPRLSTKQALTKYIKSQLGAPSINVEVSDSQVSEIIDDAVQRFTEYAYGTLEGVVIVQLNGAKEYPLPNTITNVVKLTSGLTNSMTNFSSNFGSGYVPDVWSSQSSGSFTGDIIPTIIGISATQAMLDKYFSTEVVYNFNHLKKSIQVFENFKGPAVLHYQYEYIADPLSDLVYDHPWIKGYSKARVKELWGTVTGKFSQSLIGGATVNYDRLLQESQQELDKLDEELLNRWSDPAPIFVG